MQGKIKDFLSNSWFALLSNGITLLISVLTILIFPKLIGVREYGFWQLYLFYVNLIGFFHLGWVDGIYLRNGGKEYVELDKKELFNQFIGLSILQIIFSIIIWAYALFNDSDKVFVFILIGFSLIFTNVRYFFIYILQTTNNIKESSKIIISDRIIYVFIIFFLLILEQKDYKLLILADCIGRFISLIYSIIKCRDISLNNISLVKIDILAYWENIKIGGILMISSIANMLILGIFRFFIDERWGIEIFGKVSLILSISNLLMVFISALGIVFFPLLKRTEKARYPEIYENFRLLLTIIMLGCLALYYPLSIILSYWLPEYQDFLIYLLFTFPCIVYEAKMSLLIVTYLKALRLENILLKVNLLSFLFSGLLVIGCIVLDLGLDKVILLMPFAIAARCLFAEYNILKVLSVRSNKIIFYEIIMIIIFISSGAFLDFYYSIFIYLVAYFLYVCFYRKRLIALKRYF